MQILKFRLGIGFSATNRLSSSNAQCKTDRETRQSKIWDGAMFFEK